MGMEEGTEATVIGANILSYFLFLLVLSSDAARVEGIESPSLYYSGMRQDPLWI